VLKTEDNRLSIAKCYIADEGVGIPRGKVVCRPPVGGWHVGNKELLRPTPPPSFFRLMLFRMTRTSIKYIDQKYRDYQYYKEKGWFEADYYYATSLGLPKRLAGYLFDFIGRQMVKHQ
jgi:hypothetical protein